MLFIFTRFLYLHFGFHSSEVRDKGNVWDRKFSPPLILSLDQIATRQFKFHKIVKLHNPICTRRMSSLG